MKKTFVIVFLFCFLTTAHYSQAVSDPQNTNGAVDSVSSEKVNSFTSNNLDRLEKFRAETTIKLADLKLKTQKDIAYMESQVTTVEESLNEKKNLQDAVKKPIAHIKLIILSILVFIFATKIFFYGLLILLILYILRSIYRKIKR